MRDTTIEIDTNGLQFTKIKTPGESKECFEGKGGHNTNGTMTIVENKSLDIKTLQRLSSQRLNESRTKTKILDFGERDTKTPKPKHNRKINPSESYKCPHCPRLYKWSYNLSRHMKYECGKQKQFECHICKKMFNHKHNVIKHIQTLHGIDKQVALSLCNRLSIA